MSAVVEFDFFKRSGNGGQKRNKTSSAVRVTLKEFGVSAEDCTERSQKLNRIKALQKLKKKLAMSVRQEMVQEKLTAVSPSNQKYPLFLARLLDLLESVGFSFKECGLALGMSSSQVEKLLRKDTALWQYVQKNVQRGTGNDKCGTINAESVMRD